VVPPTATERRPPLARFEIVGLGLVMLCYVAIVVFELRHHLRPNFDENIFMDVGRQITLTGLPYRTLRFPKPTLFFDHTPLYVYWVAGITLLGGPTFVLLRATTLIFGVLTVLGVYWVGRTMRGPVAGLVAASIVATNPFFATYSWFVRMEIPLCCALVFALLAMIHRRFLVAGVLIAVAVMLKEIALGFAGVAVVYVALTQGFRAALAIGLPTVLALAAWFTYAAAIGRTQLISVLNRWFESAAGGTIEDPRFDVRPSRWAQAVVQQVVGLTGILAVGAAVPVALLERRRIPAIVIVPAAYVLLAVASSFLIALKEPRYLIAVVPMLAITISLIANWDGFAAAVVRRAKSSFD
jgi:4-amino-4-deoxy-L-arabinose transferase-like glycosyltransferase